MNAATLLAPELDPPKRLTARQQQVLDFIVTYRAAHAYQPTIREISEAMGIRSTNGTVDHLRALERKGYLTRDADKARGIVVLTVPGIAAKSPHAEPEMTDLERQLTREVRHLKALLRNARALLAKSCETAVGARALVATIDADVNGSGGR